MEIQKNRGFTLIELLIVIILLSIVAIIISIKMPGISVNLDIKAEQLANDIRYTQNLSMARNQRYRLVTSASGDSYDIKDGSGNVDYTITLETGTTISPTNYTIIFNSKGIPYSDESTPLASTATIVLSAAGKTKSVLITPVTGRVAI